VKKTIRLTENELSAIIKENINIVLNENGGPVMAYHIKDYRPGEEGWNEIIAPNKKQIWDFLDNGYKRAGLDSFRGCDNHRSLFKNANLISIAYCADTWVAISVYTGYRGGFKCVGITATIDDEFRMAGVAAVHDIIKRDVGLYDELYWTECSGKIAELYEKYDGIKIPFEFAEQMVKPIIKKVDEFYFRRLELGTTDYDASPLRVVYGFNNKETYDAVYEKYSKYIDDAIAVIKNRRINEEVESPSFGRYSSVDCAESIVNLFVDIRWTEQIYEFPEEKLKLLEGNVNVLISFLSSRKCPEDKVQRIQQAIENGREILNTSIPMRLNRF